MKSWENHSKVGFEFLHTLGPARLTRHPCRDAHCAMPAFGQRGLTGRPRSKAKAKQSKAKARHIQHLRSCATAIASKLAPTLDLQQPQNSCTPLPLVGASLLAMGPAHPTSSSTVTSPSRAGSLPHWIFSSHKTHVHRYPLWERACSRWGRHIQHHCKLTHRFREQARSHRGNAVSPRTRSALRPPRFGF